MRKVVAVVVAVVAALTTWSGCADGTRLGFAVWPGGAHDFPRPPVTNPAAAQAIGSFFTQTRFAPLPR